MYITLKAIKFEDIENFINLANGFQEIYQNNKYVFKKIVYENSTITFYFNLTITIETNNINQSLRTKLLSSFMDNQMYIGSDEVGNGEPIGPIIVCGVTFKNIKQKEDFFLLGMIDSKKLNYERINNLGKRIENETIYKCITVSVKSFNDNYSKLNVNTKVLNSVIHNRIHSEIGSTMEGRISVIDEFAKEKKYFEYINSMKNETVYKAKYIFETKAENKYLEVAAASILAKYFFNKNIINVLVKNNINPETYIKTSINYRMIMEDINKKIISIDDHLIKI